MNLKSTGEIPDSESLREPPGDAAAFLAVAEDARDPVWAVAPDGRPGYANRRFAELFVPDGGPLGVAVAPEDLPELRELFAGGMPFERELRLRLRDGGRQRFRVRLTPLRGAGWVAVARRSAQRREGDLQYRALAEAAPEAIVVFDEEEEVHYANAAASRVFGYPAEEIVGASFSRLVPGGLGPQRAVVEREESGSWRAVELVGRCKAGAEVPLEAAFSAFERDGRRYVAGMLRDLTDRRRAEEERDRFFSLSIDLLCVAAPEGRFTKVNPAFERTLGYSREELVSRPFADFVHPGDREATAREVERLRRGLPTIHFENRYRRKDGEYVRLSWKAMRDARTGSIFAAARDVTGERRAREELAVRAAQQAAVARLGRRALETFDLRELMDEASEIVARTLGVRYASVMKVLEGEEQLLVFAGAGWTEEVVGRVRVEAGRGSHAGYTLQADGPVVVEDLPSERRFRVPPKLREAGIVSGVSEVIRAPDGRHFGVLSAHSTRRRTFTENDVDFVRSISNVLAAAVERDREREELRASAERLAEQAEILDRAHVLIRDLDDRIVFWNSGAEELYGYSREEALGRTTHELLGTLHPKPYGEIRAELLDRGFWSGELVHTTRSGQRVVVASYCALHRGPGGEALAVLEVNNDVTRLRQTERELRRSEARFRSLVQNLEDVISVVDEEGRFLYACSSVEVVLGYEPEEVLGRVGFDLVHPDDLPRAREFFGGVLAGSVGRKEKIELRLRHKSALWRTVEASAADLREDPAVGGVIVTFRDVTERREVERAARESHARLRSIVEGTRESIFLKDSEGRYLLVNSRGAEVLGRSAEEIVGKTDAEILPADVAAPLARADRRVLASGEPITVEETLPAGGEQRTFIVTKSAYRDGTGEIAGVIGVATDITSLKQTREALRQSKDLYRAVIMNATENIFLLDAETKRIIEANPAFRAALGYTAEEVRELEIYDVVAHDRRSIDRNLKRILSRGNCKLGERVYLRKDGTFLDVEVGAAAISYGGRRAVCVVSHYITERLRAEEAAEEVRELERYRIARDLHDLVLQHIVSTLQSMQAEDLAGGTSPLLPEQIGALREAVRGLRGAIYDLRTESNESFARAVEALVEEERRAAPELTLSLSVAEDFPKRLPEKTATQLARAVREALANLRKHSGAKRADVSLRRADDALTVEVSDDGRGFPLAGPGSERREVGFGIAGMRERLALLGGELRVRSEPGRGTSVSMKVPFSPMGGGDLPGGSGRRDPPG